MLAPGESNPELWQVPEADQGIDLENALLPGFYPLRELSTGRHIADNGRLVYVDEEGRRVVLAERGTVPPADQGIDFDNPLQPGVYPLKQLSTGRHIADNGRLVYVDEEGRRVPPARVGR